MCLWDAVSASHLGLSSTRGVKYHQPLQREDSNKPVGIETHLKVSSFGCYAQIRVIVSVAPLNTVVLPLTSRVAAPQRCHLLTSQIRGFTFWTVGWEELTPPHPQLHQTTS